MSERTKSDDMKRILILVPPPILKSVKAISAREDRSVCATIRVALAEYVEREKEARK